MPPTHTSHPHTPFLATNTRFLVLTLILTSPLHATKTKCTSDPFCQSTFGPSYFCDMDNGKCNHKPLIQDLTLWIVSGCLLLIAFNILSFSIGVSANGMAFPAMILFFAFTGKDAMAILKTSNILSSPVNLIFVASMRNPQNENRLFVDFDLLVYLVPLILIGSMFGVLAFGYFPGMFTYFFIFATMVYLTVSNFLKWKNTKSAESGVVVGQDEQGDIDGSISLKIGKQGITPQDIFESTHLETASEFGNSRPQKQQNFKAIISEESTEPERGVRSCYEEWTIHSDSDNQKYRQDLNSTRIMTEAPLSRLHPNLRSLNPAQSPDAGSAARLEQLNSQQSHFSDSPLKHTFKINHPLAHTPNNEQSKSIWQLLGEQKTTLLLVVLCYALMVGGNLVRGSPGRPSVLGLAKCSGATFACFFLFILAISLLAMVAYSKIQRTSQQQDYLQFSPQLMTKIGVSAMIGGFISSAGVCGSLFISSSLMLLDLEPLVIKATIGFAIFVMSLNNTFQFLFLGYFDLKNTVIIALITLVGCVVGNVIIKRQLQNGGQRGANSIISVCNFCMTGVICLVIPFTSYFESINNSSFFAFRSVC